VTVDTIVTASRASEAFQRLKENLNVGKVLIGWNVE